MCRTAGVFGVCAAAAVVAAASGQVRTLDGSENNLSHPQWGSVGQWLGRMAPPAYADGISAPAGADRPSPRKITHEVCIQSTPRWSKRVLTSMLFQWGQFLDHDITLSGDADPPERFDIPIPAGDPWFDPTATGTAVIPFGRTAWDPATGTDPSNPRRQFNEITAWIDGSMIYGVDSARAAWLRTGVGGALKTSPGDLLPFNTAGFPNANPVGADPASLFLAGDIRANEQVGLTCMHTMFVREHNRLAAELSAANPSWDDEKVYQHARLLVGSLIQKITFDEFLPALVGLGRMPPYLGYDPTVQPDIHAEFSTAAYRVGHTMINFFIARLGEDGRPIPQGPLALRDAFFNPSRIIDEGGIDPVIRGMSQQLAQEIDVWIIDDLRSFLFGPPGSGGLDLASLNIQRGRDHGLPSYNQARMAMGMNPMTSFEQMSNNPEVTQRLAQAYDSVDDIDLWVGGLAEDHLPGASVGETFATIILNQFLRLRDGDRFWYQNILDAEDLAWVEQQTLSKVIRRNTSIEFLHDQVFYVSADFNRDAELDFLDFLAYQTAFGLGDLSADFDFDGELTFFDFLAFQNAFSQFR